MEQKTFGLIDHPVAHSFSPKIHNTIYASLNLPHKYELIDCPTSAEVLAAIVKLRNGELSGLNVTIPWKQLVLEFADECASSAIEVGAANVLSLRDGKIVASNTDALALVKEWQLLLSEPLNVLVIGNGGAALATCAAAKSLGANLWVVARSFVNDSKIVPFERFGARCMPWPSPGSILNVPWEQMSLIVQSTSAGMCGADSGDSVRDLVAWQLLGVNTVAYDIIYNPPVTPFLAAAQQYGIKNCGGAGMLLKQASAAIEEWLNITLPTE
jgi:shikimate dehydrogenase